MWKEAVMASYYPIIFLEELRKTTKATPCGLIEDDLQVYNVELHVSNTMLQAGRSPVRVPDEVDIFNLPSPSSHTMALWSTQPLTEMSTRNFPGGRKRLARRADNLAAIYEPNV
jgi:hypothetical protein